MSQPQPKPTPLEQARPRQALQQRVSAAILDAAAQAFAAQGERASMHDVAVAAGVARATVYRYFPNRQALLDALAEVAVAEAAERLREVRLDDVDVDEAVARAVRTLVDVGDYFAVLTRQRAGSDPEQFARGVADPLCRLFDRGRAAGAIREDVPSVWLTESLLGLVGSVLPAASVLGKEDTIRAICSMFLEGARARPRAS